MSQRVELHNAFWWYCPDCAAENYCRGVMPELSAEERRELAEHHGIPPEATGDWMMAPDKVTCPECKRQFETNASEAMNGGAA